MGNVFNSRSVEMSLIAFYDELKKNKAKDSSDDEIE
jgi:hypothetical protein